MRSLAAQLVALALAVPVSTVSSSHAGSTTIQIRHEDAAAVHHRALGLQRVLPGAHAAPPAAARARPHRRARAPRGAARAAAAAPRLARARRCASSSRVRRTCSAATARRRARPLRLRLERFEAWVCIHRHEARLERRRRSLLGRPADGSRLHARLRQRHDQAPPRRPRRHLDAGRADRRRRARLRDARLRARGRTPRAAAGCAERVSV